MIRRLLVLGAVAALLNPLAARAQDPISDEEAALAVVHALFDAMRAKDAGTLKTLFHPEARLQNPNTSPSGEIGVSTIPIGQFVTSVTQGNARLDEQLWDEEVRVNGNLATVWTPYAMFINGELSHCGVDAFQLWRMAKGWQIIQIADTRQREGCVIPDHVKPVG